MRYLLMIIGLLKFCTAEAQEPLYDKIFFANSRMDKSYFYSETSYKNPSWIKNVQKKLPVNDSLFFTPGNSLELNYISGKDGEWQAKIIFHPSRGMDFFTPATSLVMRLMVRSSTQLSELPEVGLGNKKDSLFSYTSLQKFVTDYQQDKWMTVKIPLTEFKIDIAKSDVIIFRQQSSDGKEHSLLIDQVELLPDNLLSSTSIPGIIKGKGYEKHIDITWKPVIDTSVKYIKVYRSPDGKKFYPVGIQSPFISRYTDYTDTTGRKFFYRITFLDKNYKESPTSGIVNATTRKMTDEELLDMIQEANFRYYWEGAEKTSGLALENIHGRRNMIATGASGFGIMALITGAERKFITREALTERFEKITAFLDKADKFHGAFPHFLDGPTGKVEPFFGPKDNGADLVETSFLAQGLLAAKQYFNPANAREKKIIDKIDNIWRNIEWDWFRKDKDSKYLYWHWSPDQEWVINHKLIGWNETMITYFMAITSPTHSVPASFYYSGWASQDQIAQDYRSGWGQTKDGSKYTNGNTYFGIPLKVGVSNGGPLFFIHYSYLGLDPHKLKDAYTDYFSNNRNIALINYRYCVENPAKHDGYGPDAWGLTASDGLWNYQADEPVAHQDHGKITPTGALASFPYTPRESMRALKNYYHNYGKFAWGEYGFRDAFNPGENWCSEIFMGLNQGPIAVMIENYRSGLLWKLFMSNPEVQKAVTSIANGKP
jgi:exo beta-1,2-glucooligosaccharide sophorohydrolase (non-reducing end)